MEDATTVELVISPSSQGSSGSDFLQAGFLTLVPRNSVYPAQTLLPLHLVQWRLSVNTRKNSKRDLSQCIVNPFLCQKLFYH